MTIRTLPVLPNIFNRSTGIGFDVMPTALARWNSDIQAAKDDGESVISILDPIGADMFGEGVTAKRISAALRSIGNHDVVVNINSPGGDFFEGVAIYNLLQGHSKKVTTRILGMAASAASVIAMAGDEVQIAKSGFIMIHNTQAVVVGDRNDMRQFADALDTFDNSLADVYAARTGLETKAITKMMDKETFLSGQDAIDKGFADGFLAADEVSEKVRNEEQINPHLALRRVEAMMSRAGVPRAERLELLNVFKTGLRDAADDAVRDAGVSPELFSVLNKTSIL